MGQLIKNRLSHNNSAFKPYDIVYREEDVKEAVEKLNLIIETTEINKYMIKLHIKEIFGDFSQD